jgi:glutamyl-tRNA synthetase
LRKRGIKPEAVRKFVVAMGLSEADVTVPAEILYAENRKLIDPVSNRYFAVLDPVKISVSNAPKVKVIEAPLHPDFPKRGKRKIVVDTNRIYIERSDFENFKGSEIRLMDLFNIRLDKISEFTSREMRLETKKIQWISEPNVKIKIIMPDGKVTDGIAEPSLKNVKVGETVQFIRIGFARLDRKENNFFIFYFSHR